MSAGRAVLRVLGEGEGGLTFNGFQFGKMKKF